MSYSSHKSMKGDKFTNIRIISSFLINYYIFFQHWLRGTNTTQMLLPCITMHIMQTLFIYIYKKWNNFNYTLDPLWNIFKSDLKRHSLIILLTKFDKTCDFFKHSCKTIKKIWFFFPQSYDFNLNVESDFQTWTLLDCEA